jgi:hypothetical protein
VKPILYHTLIILGLLGIGAVFSQTVQAQGQQQPSCDTRDNILQKLSKKYKESPVAIGVTNNGRLVEVLTTENGSTWSIIISSPNGLSCLVAAGENWREVERTPDGPEA